MNAGLMHRVVRGAVFVRSSTLACRGLATLHPVTEAVNAVINPAPLPARVGRRIIEALPRTARKTRQCEKLRQNGQVPGVVHGVNEDGSAMKHMVVVNAKFLNRELRELGITLENTIYDLVLEDAEAQTTITIPVTPRQLTTNPLTDAPQSINFLKFQEGAKMRIPLRFINTDQCVDLKRGCFLLTVNHFVECVCHNADTIPQYIDVDVAHSGKGSVLTIDDLQFPSSVSPSNRIPANFVAAVIKNK